ncbi:kinase-like protein, partial [Exidia glandulosa HHB12029]
MEASQTFTLDSGVPPRASGRCAVKTYRSLSPLDAATRKQVQRELSVSKLLYHPNINVTYGLYNGLGHGHLPSMVSHWSEQGCINDYLKARSSDPDVGIVKCNLMIQIVSGLSYLHDNGIIHGDIKGANVLISDHGVARLSDFGLSKIIAEHSQTFTQDSALKGTSRWMAPELLMDASPRHTYATDIWACGCLFIEILSGTVPYHTKVTDIQVILSLSQREPPPRPPNM